MNPLLAQFIPEARDLIQTSVGGLLKLETDPGDAATVNEVFRAVHTLKGSSGLFEVVALTKLVHAAEDLLGAIRLNELALSSDLVDGLLDSLDRVGAWIDHLERYSTLPGDADSVSKSMAGALRAQGVAPSGAPPEAAPAGPTAPAVEAASRPATWLAPFTEAARRAAFRRLAGGETVHAVRYVPNEGCFYSGTDPLGIMLQIGELVALDAELCRPLAPLADLDPYASVFAFQALTGASRTELEHLFRYDLDEVEIAELGARDLLRLFGEADKAIIWSDFAELARRHLDQGETEALRTAVGSLTGMMGSTLRPVSALRWIETALAAGEAGRALLPLLVEAVVSGEIAPRSEAAAAPKAEHGPLALPGTAEGRMAARLLETQARSLRAAAPLRRLAGIATTLRNLARSLGAADFEARIAAAAADPAALAAILDESLPKSPPEVPATEAEASAEAPAEDSAAALTPTAPPAARQLKVDQAKVDLLMNLIGELVVSKNSLPFLAKRAEEVYGSRDMAREIKEQYAVIDRLAQEMQGAVMQVRMLPVSEVFARFPRLVRDLSRKLGKRIALEVEGGETAADKTIVEALGDPLLHILRNSLDHGIETAEERQASGKPAEATIRLKAYQEADSVVIEIADDGRGIDPAKIRAAAVAKGVVDAETAARLSDQEAINLIYRPGFSTAEAVSDLSGRGVGMDVVLTTVERLAGTVSVTSRLGSGTRTRLSLPLSMAVTRVMVVEVGGTLYGVPMDLIAETVRLPAAAIRTIKRAETFILRDTVIPLLRMSALLRLDPSGGDTGPEEEAVLVCRVNGAPVGLVIDEFREGIEVLLKPLEGVLARIRGYSGTALLGDGRVLLVLNLKELL